MHITMITDYQQYISLLLSRLALVGGVLIDKWLSVARGATIFCGFITVGQIVFGIGGFFRLIWLMNAGRFISGIGADSLWTAQYAGAVAWFPEKQLNFVFGLQILFSRMARFLFLFFLRIIYVYFLGKYHRCEHNSSNI